MAELDDEVDNFRAAMDWAVDRERAINGVSIVAATAQYWNGEGAPSKSLAGSTARRRPGRHHTR
ncbi:MAG: hypothetical protein R2697_09825 [Ilumatobacteraceae bacterium]